MARTRRSQAQIKQLRQQMYAVLEEDRPQSIRHIFYRMTDPTLPEPVEKSDKGYVTVQRQLTNMRRDGEIPYGWITDATRTGYFIETHNSVTDVIQDAAKFYRRDIWRHMPAYVEVWCESRSIAGVVKRETDALAVPLYPSGGFASLSLSFQAAENIKAVACGRPVHVIYIGDYDPAGVLIDRKIETELQGHLPSHEITFHRIAVNLEQIQQMGLPTKPPKKGDTRGGFTGRTVEAETIPAGVMRRLLREKIESFIPEQEWKAIKVAEESERGYLWSLAETLGEGVAP
jgi:hypothetical protein